MVTDTFVTLENLTTSDDEALADIVKRGVSKLGGVTEPTTFELRLLSNGSADEMTTFSMQLTPTGAALLSERAPDPKLVAIMSTETFRNIAQGTMPPRQALLDGSLKLQGDARLAGDIVRPLTGPFASPDACPPILVFDSYSPVVNGGTLTFHGMFFTSGASIQLFYDFGVGDGVGVSSGSATADGTGTFSAAQAGLPCGEILGKPGIGVVVTATDTFSNKSTFQTFPTPC